jgi:hypothetical protein
MTIRNSDFNFKLIWHKPTLAVPKHFSLVSELNKIALVHLYAQGYRDEALTNFELSMQTPSIIFEQEKIELMKSKAELAQSLLDQKLLPTDWIYDNIFHLSEDQYDEYRDLIREDAKRAFRVTQIENEGNDPVESGKSYGTPHDLASLYGKGRMDSDPKNVPSGYDEDETLGRPKDSISNIGKQDSNFGKDRLGTKRMKDTDKNDSSDSRTDTNKSGMALESAHVTFLKNMNMFSKMDKKKLIFEQDKDDTSLLDENQLRG